MDYKKIDKTSDKIVSVLEKSGLTFAEVSILLCDLIAGMIKTFADGNSGYHGKEYEILDILNEQIHANLAYLKGDQQIPTAGEA